MSLPSTPLPTPLLVACLCADWCGTCREYRTQFEQLTQQMTGVHGVWVDVEDESELVDPIEVEDFPTLLIASPTHTLFFGTVLPHMQTLQRLVEAQQNAGAQPLPPDADRDGLANRLWTRVGTAS